MEKLKKEYIEYLKKELEEAFFVYKEECNYAISAYHACKITRNEEEMLFDDAETNLKYFCKLAWYFARMRGLTYDECAEIYGDYYMD